MENQSKHVYGDILKTPEGNMVKIVGGGIMDNKEYYRIKPVDEFLLPKEFVESECVMIAKNDLGIQIEFKEKLWTVTKT